MRYYWIVEPFKHVMINLHWCYVWIDEFAWKPTHGFYTQGFLSKGYIPVQTFELNGREYLVEHHLNNKVLVRYTIEKEISPGEFVLERKSGLFEYKEVFGKDTYNMDTLVKDTLNDVSELLKDMCFCDLNYDYWILIVFILTLILFSFDKFMLR